MYGLFSREMSKYTVLYGVSTQVWPILCMIQGSQREAPQKNFHPASTCLQTKMAKSIQGIHVLG